MFFLIAEFFKEEKTDTWGQYSKLLCRWDCSHYANLASELSFGNAFFPLFPNLSYLAGQTLNMNPEVSVLFVASFFGLLSSWVALEFIHTCFPHGGHGGRTFLNYTPRAWIFCIILTSHPSAHFLLFGYPESLFICLFLWALMLWKKEKLALSACLFGLLAVTRPQGIWMAALFGGMWFFSGYRFRRVPPLSLILKTFGYALLVTLPFIVMVLGQWLETGVFFYFLKEQARWDREWNFLSGLLLHLPSAKTNYIILMTSLYAVWWLWKQGDYLSRFMALATLAVVEIPLYFGGLYSYSRFMLLNVGLLLLLSHLMVRHPWALIVYLFFSIPQLNVHTHQWLSGLWTG